MTLDLAAAIKPLSDGFVVPATGSRQTVTSRDQYFCLASNIRTWCSTTKSDGRETTSYLPHCWLAKRPSPIR